MLTWLSSFTLAPWLAIGGALLVLSPILIHLLNKRKFKIVDWAAMDFLLDADKRNRRRVRLENFLLLLLRCLAVFLLGLLLAQPFIPSELASRVLGKGNFEHLFILDDSLSMQVQTGNQTPFDEAKQRLVKLLDNFSKERQGDTFTLILTSQPQQRQFNGVIVSEESVGELVETVNALEATDRAADLTVTLATLEAEVKDLPKDVNRVLYVITDLRTRDWNRPDNTQEETDPAQAVARIARNLTGAYVVDVGSNDIKNLMVTEVRPEGALVAGVVSRFDVTVANFGSTEARDLVVKFKAGEALPLEAPIERIAAGQTTSVPFSFTFSGAEASDETEQETKRPLDPVRVTVEVVSTRPADEDRLLADSTAFFPARVVRGIPTLIVDGDPSSNEERSESFYLQHALQPSGPLLSGVEVDVVHESEVETLSLANYQVIFLCNVYQFSEKVRKDLEAWVERGGGLIMMPGDQVDERYYNEVYFREGQGLSPLKLEGILGDETEEKWVNFRVEDTAHPVLGVFEGQNNPALEMTKVFRWWGTSAAKGQLGSLVDVPARFNDPDASVAMAEKKFGAGRVFLSAIPADADWHIWPIYGTYLIGMEELVRHMAGDVAGSGGLRVGEQLAQAIELSDYKTDAELKLPRDKKINLQAREPGAKNEKATGSSPERTENPVPEVDLPLPDLGEITPVDDLELSVAPLISTLEELSPAPAKPQPSAAGQTRWQIVYDDTGRRGFYELSLARNDGLEEKVLFAANADPTEGDLARVDQAELRKSFGEAPVTIVSGAEAGSLDATGAQREMWKYVLLVVVVVLAGEQLLAWAFGLRR